MLLELINIARRSTVPGEREDVLVNDGEARVTVHEGLLLSDIQQLLVNVEVRRVSFRFVLDVHLVEIRSDGQPRSVSAGRESGIRAGVPLHRSASHVAFVRARSVLAAVFCFNIFDIMHADFFSVINGRRSGQKKLNHGDFIDHCVGHPIGQSRFVFAARHPHRPAP